MTPDQQRRAFDRFFRAPEVRHEAVQGFGIGLSIVKDLVEAHEGAIEIDSAPAEGTTVIIRLPMPRQRGRGEPPYEAIAAATGASWPPDSSR